MASAPRAIATPAVAASSSSRGRPVLWIAAGIVAVAVMVLVATRVLDRGSAAREPAATPASAIAATEPAVAPAPAGPAPVTAAGEPIAAPVADRAASSAPADARTPPSERAGAPARPAVPARAAPAPAAPAPAVPAPDAAAPAARARRLIALEPSAGADGETLVLRADAPLRREDVFATLIGPDPPRYLVRLSGIDRPWRPAEFAVGSPLIARVRTGIHDGPHGSELHVVLDLATRAVATTFEVEGPELRIHLRPKTP
jgi:hypothetical protein